MNALLQRLNDHPKILYFLALALILPALLIKLGVANIFLGVDEATRAIVAQEMMLSGNYITPTINGEFYYNKPPLYNWILIVFFQLSGSMSEFVMRLPNILGLLVFAYIIYYFNSRHFDKWSAALLGLFIITAGRVLFWESYFAYIDITFSAVIYANFMVIYHLGEKGRIQALFFTSYLLTAIAFMLKGMPAIVFQGITLLVYFIWQKKFLRLISLSHILGGFAFLIPVGLYYYFYNQYNDLSAIWAKLWMESAQRTAVYNGFYRSAKHLLEFPLEMFYHYVPWSLFILFLFKKGFWEKLSKHPYIKYCFLAFAFNIILYWTSPEVYPKYILMLIPLIYTVGFFFFQQSGATWMKKGVNYLFIFAAAGASLCCLIFPFLPATETGNSGIGLGLGLFPFIAFITFLMWKLPEHRLILFISAMLLFHIAFSWFIWSKRDASLKIHEAHAAKVVEITKDQPLNYLNFQPVQHGSTFYWNKGKEQIIHSLNEIQDTSHYYILISKKLEEYQAQNRQVKVFYEFPYVETGTSMSLVKFK